MDKKSRAGCEQTKGTRGVNDFAGQLVQVEPISEPTSWKNALLSQNSANIPRMIHRGSFLDQCQLWCKFIAIIQKRFEVKEVLEQVMQRHYEAPGAGYVCFTYEIFYTFVENCDRPTDRQS